ncbi:MAG TPA: alpha-hydroxy-acid oxidizing protein [Gemmatimonadales bacterium]|nr:alpha-hydroxy-acid oxidizing protein [Gemmatimonadales bacterium]
MSSPGSGSFGVARQIEIYNRGSLVPVGAEALEQRACELLSREALGYLAGGAGSEDTMRANLAAFRRWRIEPRVLRDLSCRAWSTSLFDTQVPAPVLLAPVGVQGLFHQEGELASARAGASLGVPVILSSASSVALEDVAAAMGNAPRWFQLYWSADPDVAISFVRRAERAGFSAIVVTVDCPILAWRERDLANAYTPFLHGHGIANYLTDPAFCAKLPCPPAQDPAPAIRRFVEVFGNAALTWEDLGGLRRHTGLPILVKGILHPDDAERALDVGVDGIVVSNHGGRQVDGAVASLDALPRVAERVGGRVPVLLDGGIRRGADAVKALALGASAVLLGRLYAWGLAVGGEAGVREVLLNFLADFDLTAGLSGCTCVRDLRPELLRLEG